MLIHIQAILVINESRISYSSAFKSHVLPEGFLKEIFMPVVIFFYIKRISFIYRILRNVDMGQYLRTADGLGCRMNTHIRVLVILCL